MLNRKHYPALYIGQDESLKGMTALVYMCGSKFYAQFDDDCIPEGHGWHPFSLNEFMPLRPGDEDYE